MDPLDLATQIADDHAAWWPRMQHYETPTRMLDVTTNPLFGLLFACVDWQTGRLSADADGVVYVFAENGGFVVRDLATEEPSIAPEYYDAQHEGVPFLDLNRRQPSARPIPFGRASQSGGA